MSTSTFALIKEDSPYVNCNFVSPEWSTTLWVHSRCNATQMQCHTEIDPKTKPPNRAQNGQIQVWQKLTVHD